MRVFVETQRFNQIWLWVLIIALDTVFLTLFAKAVYYQLYLGIPIGNNPISNTGLILLSMFVILLLAGITLLLFFSRLHTRIENDGVSFKFNPFMGKWKNIPIVDIQHFEVKKFNPITEFGGWGYRKVSGKLLVNTSGNTALFIKTIQNQLIVIGTQFPDEVANTMQKLMNKKDNN
ncbi:DUF6141 family protein [Fulvivirga lutea]|uniref:Uncharacterized protein n=1 Tax=Fulvivirga lutea TaxID=2810512 RepID=A0A974WF98_9BACT|nr:DUF6141 family protein [Fulvivirga lutea]QSE97141.1 hypothetical protein JR347_16340 [Fulvivirga lutea]